MITSLELCSSDGGNAGATQLAVCWRDDGVLTGLNLFGDSTGSSNVRSAYRVSARQWRALGPELSS